MSNIKAYHHFEPYLAKLNTYIIESVQQETMNSCKIFFLLMIILCQLLQPQKSIGANTE